MDFTSIRNKTILLNGLNSMKMAQNYYMYFDETGNCRRFWIKNGKYNVSPLSFFVLGGIAAVCEPHVDAQTIRKFIGVNPTVQEIKSKHIFHGETLFEDCLRQESLKKYLNLLIEQGWFVHFGAVDLFYYGIVDIIDSLIDTEENIFELKNELYRIFCNNLDEVLTLMIQYEYPDIKKDKIQEFLVGIIGIIDNYIINTRKANTNTYMLRCYVILGKNKEELVFIQDEKRGELLHDFFHFYQRPIYMFVNSKIYFDQEQNIETMFGDFSIIIDNRVQKNYQFLDSKDNIMIQLSDVFVGIMAKYLQFVSTNIDIVEVLVGKFDETQISSFRKLNYILNKSVDENKAFWDMFVCQDTRRMISHLAESYG